MRLRWFESAKRTGDGTHPLEFNVFCMSGLFRKLLLHAEWEEQVKDSSQSFPSKNFCFLFNREGVIFGGLGLLRRFRV